jgi:hypothetical protein
LWHKATRVPGTRFLAEKREELTESRGKRKDDSMSESIIEPVEAGQKTAEKWTSWHNPVATPERWIEVRRAVEAGMSQIEASKVFNISYEAIRQRAAREEWITEKRLAAMKEAAKVTSESQRGAVSEKPAETAIVALSTSLEGHRSRTVTGLAKLAQKGVERAISADLPIENWQDAKIVADIAMKLHNVGQEGVNVNVLVGGDGGFDGPLIEISEELGDDDIDE